MPKTHSDLWNKITSFENLYDAYLKARRGKRYRSDVLIFSANLEENLLKIQKQLLNKTYRPKTYKQFYVYDPKKRLIQAPMFEDRIVHHALVNVIEPLFERKFIYDSYACRKGKGVHKAVLRLQKFQRIAKRNYEKVYVLKADISSYFPSIDRKILLDVIKRTIRDKNALWLCERIVFDSSEPKSIPIGSLTSQLFANVYLNELDHYIKDTLGIRFYLRYMDDFVLLYDDKKKLHQLLDKIETFLKDRLNLKLNPKTAIFPLHRGVDFAGYRTWPTHILPRKRTIKRAKKRFKKFAALYREGKLELEYIKASLISFLGYVKHCNSYRTTRSVLERLVLLPPENC